MGVYAYRAGTAAKVPSGTDKHLESKSCRQSYEGLFLQVGLKEPQLLIQVSGNLNEQVTGIYVL